MANATTADRPGTSKQFTPRDYERMANRELNLAAALQGDLKVAHHFVARAQVYATLALVTAHLEGPARAA